MAENESLDLDERGGRRWRAIKSAFGMRSPAQKITELFARQLRRSLRVLVRDPEFRFAELVAAIGQGDRDTFRQLVRSSSRHRDYAELLELAAGPASDPPRVLERWLGLIRDRVFDQCGHGAIGSSVWTDFQAFRAHRDEVRSLLQPRLDAIAQDLARQPGNPPRMPRRAARERALAQTELLSTSLLVR
ncbi:MAG: hypothetical protein U1D55_04410 [Phycisphaerae bacterium]